MRNANGNVNGGVRFLIFIYIHYSSFPPEGRVMPDFEQAKEFLGKEQDQAKEMKLERSLERGLERGFGF